MELLVAFNQRGQTILLASHDLQLVGRHARRVINMRDGKLTGDTQAGEPER
jgi:ABC-type ATPase involved in cell division